MPPCQTNSGGLATLLAAAVCCLAVFVTASCGGPTEGGGDPVSTATLPTVATGVAAPGSESASAATDEPALPAMRARGDERQWQQVLGRLDRLRSRAFERLRPALLKQVYARGSPVLRHERAVLDDYRDRGVRLLGVRLRITKLRVLSADHNQVLVRVIERLGPTTAVVGSRRVRLPVDAPTWRVLHLDKGDDGWRITAVRRVSG